jgi:hypothetical protein
MAITSFTYPASGSDYTVSFPYLDKSHVKVSVDGEIVSYTWVNTSTIRLTPAPITGQYVKVYRETSHQTRLVDFTAPSILDETTLDTDSIQAFNMAQEALDVAKDAATLVKDLGLGSVVTGTLQTVNYTGDGVTTVYTLPVVVVGGSRAVLVAVDGVTQRTETYTVLGATLIFSEAPPVGALIDLRVIGAPADISIVDTSLVTATGGTVERTLADRFADIVNAADFATTQLAADAAGGRVFIVPAAASVTVSVPSQYATVSLALAAIERWQIPASATVTISVAAGTYTHTVPVVITHPYASRIVIKGADTVSHTLTGFVSASGAAGAWDVIVSVSSVGTAAAGQYLLIDATTTGTGDHFAHRGVWRITAVDGGTNRLTLRNTHWGAAFPTNTLSGGLCYRLSTVLKFTGCDGFVVKGAVLGMLEDVVIAGNASDYWTAADVSGTEKGTFGIIVSGETVAQNGKVDHENRHVVAQGGVSFGQYVGVSDFDQQGIVCSSGGSIFGRYGASSSNRRRGWYAEACGQIQCKNAIGSGNYLDGFIADVGGAIICNLSTASGNGGNGVSSIQGGAITATSCVASGNVSHGFHARGGFLNCGSSTSTLNGADGYHAEYAGVMLASSCVASSNVNDGFEANHNATIRALTATATDNGRYGVRASSGGNIDCTPLTASGNVTAAKSADSLGIIVDTTYEDTLVPAGLGTVGAITGGSTITATGYLRTNNGANNTQIATTSAGDCGFTLNSTGRLTLKLDGTLIAGADNAQDLGRTATRWRDTFTASVRPGAGTAKWTSGAGSPEGSVTAVVGSLYTRTDGGAGTTLYIKESGTGNVGWVAK